MMTVNIKHLTIEHEKRTTIYRYKTPGNESVYHHRKREDGPDCKVDMVLKIIFKAI